MAKKEQRDTARVEAVLALIRKQTPLTVKQEKFCNYACVERFLKAKGDNVKRAAKQLRACLSWRESIGTEHLVADEFSAELADGLAYVAGHDDESRPVMIFRMKQDYQKLHSQKKLTRLLAFTMEVAVSTMPKNVQQFVMLFDASFYRSASALMNLLLAALKITGEYYPGRLHKAFIIDPPSLFVYLWKGVGAVVELSGVTTVVSSVDLEESEEMKAKEKAKIGSCSSSRFAFTVSHHVHSFKPWYLSLSDTSASLVGPTQRTPRPSFLQSPWLRRGRAERETSRESLIPFFKFYRRPYDETLYRSKMRPPLGGLVSSHVTVRRHHLSLSQRF
ncbi:phosphatidylinositol/phosphatidylcholine transfer protein SFH6-like [Abrus precatorius]|uniref:Phosphatidylinositol/phosphatidylcholine transfer protein SFH6-like n=1 Tax=Abrus precatorius TaxID=3816 RepID=A0A8B8M3J4_ABRPR|nr:phosphatidylinositol/phosphatidylcholine transfer protein SFH6-like [Abrus precatorius]